MIFKTIFWQGSGILSEQIYISIGDFIVIYHAVAMGKFSFLIRAKWKRGLELMLQKNE